MVVMSSMLHFTGGAGVPAKPLDLATMASLILKRSDKKRAAK